MLWSLLVALLLVLGPTAVAAQGTTDVITGVVVNDRDQPVVEALIEATSIETQVTRTTKTNAKGRYTIVFPDGGGQYRITVRSIGSTPVQKLVTRQADEDRLVVNVKMSSVPVVLEELRVRGRRPIGDRAPEPGSTERVVTPEVAARLPIDASDLLSLATLAPGVVSIAGDDSTAAGISVAGQRPTANNFTLDGLTFGGASVPQDAVRSTRVITNTYDPSRGQFSGGLIATTTRSGTNVAQGSANYNFRDKSLTLSSTGDDPFSQGFTQHQLSFGLGGPVKKDRLFLFGSALGRLRDDALQSLLSANAATYNRLGLAADSVERLLGILGTEGVPIDTRLSSANRDNDSFTSLVRADLILGENNTLTVRGDIRRTTQDPTRVGPLSVPSAATQSTQRGGGVMMSLNSRFGGTFVNELRAYASSSSNDAPFGTAIPGGRVQVLSELEDVGRGATAISFGGTPGLPQHSSSRGLEATDEVSWIPGAGAHRIKLGGLLNRSQSEDDASPNRFGTFTFASLADLEDGRPATFTRTLSPRIRNTTTTNGAVYLADSWRASDALQLTYGFRLERTVLSGAPALNSEIASEFGIRTDQWPTEWHLSPRIGFTWTARGEGNGPPKWVLRGGVGDFRSTIPTGLLAAAQAAPGFGETESQLVCIGSTAPIPDWRSYAVDASAIPTACLTGTPGPLPTQRPNVTAFDQGFGAPRALRASFGIQRRIGLATFGAEVSHARGDSQFGVRDKNLGDPRFTLSGEGRPVFAPADAIDARTGAIPVFASRRDPDFGNVLVFDSELESRTTQVVFSANGVTRKGAFYNLSYTWTRSRDQSSFSAGSGQRGFGAPTTAGDPNVREWATSDFERRHALLATITYPFGQSLEVTTIFRLTSGAPYTPMVGEDINGDGSRNDRAFIYGALAADTALGNAMGRVLERVSCVDAQVGEIAGRNTCRGPWQTSLDLQLNVRPGWLGLNHRLTMSVVTANLLVGVDQLFHGPDNLHGWGQQIRPDQTLLYVRSFDPATATFHYAVNERFGATQANTVAFRQPFQVGLQLRYTLGPDRLAQFRAGLRAGAGGGNPIERFTSLVPNAPREILAIKIALRLTDEQVAKLETLADSVDRTTKALATKAAAQLSKAGPNPDPGALFATMRPLFQSGRETHAWALKESEGILTPEQWHQVPDRIKTPPRQGFGGGNRGERGRPPSQ